MAARAPAHRDDFLSDLESALQTANKSRSGRTVADQNRIFGRWTRFCAAHGVAESLCNVPDSDEKICYLLVFGMRLRRRGRRGEPVRAGTVEDALLAVGTGISHLGFSDPRKPVSGSSSNHPLLQAFLKAMRDEDDPASRVYPANLTIIRALPLVLDFDDPDQGVAETAVFDLIIVAFFWLMRPAEYTYLPNTPNARRTQAFRLCDIQFDVAGRLRLATDPSCNDATFLASRRAVLTFADQKNAVRGETITHHASGDRVICPVRALARRVRAIRQATLDPTTPINYVHLPSNDVFYISGEHVTRALRLATTHVFPQTGIPANLVSARSLRPGGATALMCAGVDRDMIQLLGRWKSDAMLRYLRVAAAANIQPFSRRMLENGSYTFAPAAHQVGPQYLVPTEAPAGLAAIISDTDE